MQAADYLEDDELLQQCCRALAHAVGRYCVSEKALEHSGGAANNCTSSSSSAQTEDSKLPEVNAAELSCMYFVCKSLSYNTGIGFGPKLTAQLITMYRTGSTH